MKEQEHEQISELNGTIAEHGSALNNLWKVTIVSRITDRQVSDIKKQIIALRSEQSQRIRPAIAVLAWREELEERKKAFIYASRETMHKKFEELKRCIYSPALIQHGKVIEAIPTNAPYQEASAVNAEKEKTKKKLAEGRVLVALLDSSEVKIEILRQFGKAKKPTTNIPDGELILEPFASAGKMVVLCRVAGVEDNFLALTRTESLEKTTLSSDAFDRACEMAQTNKNRRATGQVAQTFRFNSRTRVETTRKEGQSRNRS